MIAKMLPLLAALLIGPGDLTEAEFQRLCKDLALSSKAWASIPWKVSINEARALAMKQGKPLFLQINTGNPIGFA